MSASSSKAKIYITLLITLILIGFSVYSASKKTAGKYTAEIESKQFTNFLDKVNDITSVKMASKGQIFHAKKSGENWFLPDYNNYPVKFEKVRDIVVNAANLEVLDKKTNDPKRHKDLGLDDPMQKDSKAIRIIFEDQSMNVLDDFVVGNGRKNGGKSFYARKQNSDQTFLVKGEGWMKLTLNPNYWLQSEIFQLDEDEYKEVLFDYPTKENKDLTIHREKAETYAFKLKDIGDLKISSNSKLRRSIFALNTIQLVGVEKKDFLEFKENETLTIKFTTFNNMQMEIKSIIDKDSDRWIKIKASSLEGASDATKEKVKKINDFVKNWIYIVSENSAINLTPRFDELTKKEE